MKKTLAAIVAICCSFAICIALAGCFGPIVDKSLYTGTWTLASTSDENIDEKSIELMREMGTTVDLVLNEDGTGSLKLFGESAKNLTWEAKSNTEGTASADGAQLKMTLNDGKLTLIDNANVSMTFEPKTSATTASTSASAASSASASSSAESASSTAAPSSEQSADAGSQAAEGASSASAETTA